MQPGASGDAGVTGASRSDGGAAVADGGGMRLDAGSSAPQDAGGASMSANEGPQILSLSSNVTVVHEDVRLVFSAIVTDPDGVDDLIGGRLLAPGGGTYGTFATAAQEGAYSLTLTWDEINAVDDIVASPGSGEHRSFRAEFFDVAGHLTSRDLTLELTCRAESWGACDGRCVDLATDEACGACDKNCEEIFERSRANRLIGCAIPNCLIEKRSTSRQSCAATCQGVGLRCIPMLVDCGPGAETGVGCANYLTTAQTISDCADVPAAVTAELEFFTDLACICVD